MRTCLVEDCDTTQIRGRGWCGKHYARWHAHGDPEIKFTAYGDPIEQRLRAKIAESASGCWEWTANTDSDGYGIVKVDGKNRKAHRVSYELFVGPIPEGLQIDHFCRVRNCINPTHLEPVTAAENQERGANRLMKTHCQNGHPYTSENVKLNSSGKRCCRICLRDAQARYRAKPRSEV